MFAQPTKGKVCRTKWRSWHCNLEPAIVLHSRIPLDHSVCRMKSSHDRCYRSCRLRNAAMVVLVILLALTTFRCQYTFDAIKREETSDDKRQNVSMESSSLIPLQVHIKGTNQVVHSAMTLLSTPPPFQDDQILRLNEDDVLIATPNTIVTAYFRIPSKHTTLKYDIWMQNMLSLQDAMEFLPSLR